MAQPQLKDLWQKIRGAISGLKKPDAELLRKPLHWLVAFVTSWWRALIVIFSLLIFLYYPLGGILINNLDNTTAYEIKTRPEQSATAEMMALLIKREVNQKLWTPALPFFFPSAWLDNMPNYQLGMMSAVSKTAKILSATQDRTITSQEEPSALKQAAELLQYPGTVWMFSPQNPLLPAPSAASQYAKARKLLVRYNKFLAAGVEVYYKSPEDLATMLKQISFDINKKGILPLEAQIREESSSFTDFKADNVFFYAQGKAYGYYLMLQALAHDYKDIIVNQDLYPLWTQMLSSLETAATIRPLLVRNGELDDTFSPNHLSYLSFYMLKAQKTMLTIADKLSEQPLPVKDAK